MKEATTQRKSGQLGAIVCAVRFVAPCVLLLAAAYAMAFVYDAVLPEHSMKGLWDMVRGRSALPVNLLELIRNLISGLGMVMGLLGVFYLLLSSLLPSGSRSCLSPVVLFCPLVVVGAMLAAATAHSGLSAFALCGGALLVPVGIALVSGRFRTVFGVGILRFFGLLLTWGAVMGVVWQLFSWGLADIAKGGVSAGAVFRNCLLAGGAVIAAYFGAMLYGRIARLRPEDAAE